MKKLFCFLGALALATSGWSFAFITGSSSGRMIKWPPGTVSLRLMLGGSSTLIDGNPNFDASAQAAAQAWNAVMGTVQFQTTVASGTAGDGNGVNELAFSAKDFGQDFGANVLAITTTYTHSGRRSEADTLFNTAFTWNSYDGPTRSGVVDLQRVAIHELGHNLGLDHPDEAGQFVTAIMNSHVSGQDSLATDDIDGVQALYGPPGVPPNDNFANAIAVTLGSSGTATVTGFNTNATHETGEPTHASNAGTRSHSVWWKWTASAPGSLTVDTRNSYFDTTLGVYSGNNVASLNTIATNDDIQSQVVIQSSITFTATAGTTYFFAVDGFDNDSTGAESGGITLNLSFSPASGTLPTITTQPTSVSTTVGLNPAFSVTATAGTSPITYQWFFNNTAISGATGATLNLTNVQTANAGSYFVTVSTNAGSVNSSAVTLTVNAAVVVTPPPSMPVSSGGGGGGAPSEWFLLALGAAGLARLFRRR